MGISDAGDPLRRQQASITVALGGLRDISALSAALSVKNVVKNVRKRTRSALSAALSADLKPLRQKTCG